MATIYRQTITLDPKMANSKAEKEKLCNRFKGIMASCTIIEMSIKYKDK